MVDHVADEIPGEFKIELAPFNGKLPCDTHAATRVTIVKKCVHVKQILPTIGSAALKMLIVP